MKAPRGSPLLVVFLVVFLDLLAFGLILPLLPFYTLHFDLSAFWGGVLMASYSLMQFLFAPVWGRVSDRVGRRPVILVSVAGTIVSMIVFAFAWNFWVLLAARVFAGVAGANISTAQAYVADVTTPENRSKGMGMVGAAIGLGFVFGPAVGGILGRFGYAVPSLAAAGLAALNLLLAFLFLKESRGPESAAHHRSGSGLRSLPSVLSRPVVGRFLLSGFVLMLAFSAMESSFGFFAESRHRWTSFEVGLILTYVGVLIAFMQGGAIGPLTRRFGEGRLLVAGLVGTALGLAIIPIGLPAGFLFVSLGIVALSQGMASPSLSSILSQTAEPHERGLVLGAFQSLQALGRVIGPLWATAMFTFVAPSAPYGFSAALALLAALIAWGAARLWSARRAREATPSEPAAPEPAGPAG